TGIKEIDTHPDFDPRAITILKWALDHIEDISFNQDWIGYEDDHFRISIEFRNNENVFLAFPRNLDLDEGEVTVMIPRTSIEKFHQKVKELLEWKLQEILKLHKEILGISYNQ
ncbi:MAG: hypothetical protein QXS52_03690, partial [Thermoplasmata archaeon]